MKVYYNLLDSNIFYEYEGYKFVFSTEFLLNKFKRNMKDYIYNQNARINIKYNIKIDLYLYLLVSLYIQVEKRGFLIYKGNKQLLESPQFKIEMIE